MPKSKPKQKFKTGDKVIVLGDYAGAGHEFMAGTVGVVGEIDWSPDGTLQWEYEIGEAQENGAPVWDTYWVAESDLKLEYVPVTEDELTEVYKLLGATP